MDSERFNKALGRLEAAIERLEHVAPRMGSGESAARIAALEERHQRLRTGTSDALARLDRLIDGATTPMEA